MIRHLGIIQGIFAGLLFGMATPISKSLLLSMNSFQLAGLLYLGGALIFAGHAPFFTSNALKKSNQMWHKIVGVVVAGGIIGPVALLMGLKTSLSSSVSVWLNMELVATALLGRLFFKEHIGKLGVFGIILTLMAGLIVSQYEGEQRIASSLWILLACFAWGLDNQLSSTVDFASPRTVTFIKGLSGGLTNIAIGFFVATWSATPLQVGGALITGMAAYGLSIVLYVSSAQSIGAVRSQILFGTSPFFGILFASVFLDENIGYELYAAMLFLGAGIVMTLLANHTHEHIHMAMQHLHDHAHNDEHHDHNHETVDKIYQARHSHVHVHDGVQHSHRHMPDIHHRHLHTN